MLEDMTKHRATAVVPHDGGDGARSEVARPRRRRGLKRFRREKVVKQSWLSHLLRPIGIALALILSTYALMSLGTTFYRSYQRHIEHTAAVHKDNSILDIFFPDQTLPSDAVDLVVKDVDGNLHKVVVSKSATDQFVNDTILMLDAERAR